MILRGCAVASVSGSVVVRRQLGRRLRALRENARKRRVDVVTAKICSHTELERIEYGQGPVRPGDVRELGLFHGADPDTIEALVAMSYATNEPGWWEQYSDAMRPDFGLYLSLEATAGELRAYESEFIHGLLQVPTYTQVIEHATRLDATPETVQRFMELRRERQEVLHRNPHPLRAEIIRRFEVIHGKSVPLEEYVP